MLSKEETINSFKKSSGLSENSMNTYLSKANKFGEINRIRRGVYISPEIKDKFVIASQSVKDGYIAFHSALEYYGLNTSEPNCVQTACRNRFRIFRYDYHTFVRVPAIATTGILRIDTPEGTLRCTSITRTILDCIIRPNLCGGLQELWNAFLAIEPNDIDYEELTEILAELNNKSLYQKVGYYFSHFRENTKAPDSFLQLCQNKKENVVSAIQSSSAKCYAKDWNIISPSELENDKGKKVLHYLTEEEKKKILFISAIIEEFKKVHGLTTEDCLEIFESKHILEYLDGNWEVMHTTGFEETIQDIDDIVRMTAENKGERDVHHDLPDMISSIVAKILKDYDNTPYEALLAFYKSSTFSKLENWDTGFWKKTSQELYDKFCIELSR